MVLYKKTNNTRPPHHRDKRVLFVSKDFRRCGYYITPIVELQGGTARYGTRRILHILEKIKG